MSARVRLVASLSVVCAHTDGWRRRGLADAAPAARSAQPALVGSTAMAEHARHVHSVLYFSWSFSSSSYLGLRVRVLLCLRVCVCVASSFFLDVDGSLLLVCRPSFLACTCSYIYASGSAATHFCKMIIFLNL